MGKGWIIGAALIWAMMAGGGAQALDTSARHQAEQIAQCTGRMSAVVEFDWLLNPTRADEAARQRQAFVDVLEAMMPYAEAAGMAPREVLAQRISAKRAHAELLHIIAFSPDDRQARHARQLSERFIRACHTLILS